MRVWLRQLPAGVAKQADHRMDPITKRRTRSGTSLPFGISAESTQTMADFYNKRATIIDGATHPGIIAGNHADEVIQTITEFAKQ